MAETFEAIYKCRLCGETFNSGITGETIAHATLIGFATDVDTSKITGSKILLNEVHYCKDGSHGFADFQGFRKVVK